jgi:AraC-like DNA-binding protein
MPKLILSSDFIPRHFPPARRATAWFDHFQEHIGQSPEFTADEDVPFRAQFEAVPLADAAVWNVGGTFTGANRTKAAIVADGSDCPVLVYNLAKPFRIVQGGRDAVVATGSATLFTEGAVGAFEFKADRPGEDQVMSLNVRVPRTALVGAIGNPEDHLLRPIGAEAEPLRVLKSYADMLLATGGVADPATAKSISDHLIDLAALALGAGRDAADVARERGLRAGRLNEVLGAIKAGYADPSFSLRSIAQKQRVSERYLRDLLHESGSGFTERVLELRLQHAWRLLAHRRHGHRKVSDIAFTVGFNEVSYFNRSFRARFGMTPRDARATAIADGAVAALS